VHLTCNESEISDLQIENYFDHVNVMIHEVIAIVKVIKGSAIMNDLN
jgi:hypothetical protein